MTRGSNPVLLWTDNYLQQFGGNFTLRGSISAPNLLVTRVIIAHHHSNKTQGEQYVPSGINFYGPYFPSPTLALAITLLPIYPLHFLCFPSSVPRVSIFHYAFHGLSLHLLLVPSSCASIGHWLKFLFLEYCVPGMYNPFE